MGRVALHHKTFYRYDRPVALSPQIVRFRPRIVQKIDLPLIPRTP
jgi:transglutaminase superfamily protein